MPPNSPGNAGAQGRQPGWAPDLREEERGRFPRSSLQAWSLRLVPVGFVVFWSSGAIFVAVGLRYAKPFTFLSLRLLLAASIMWAVVLWLRPGLPTSAKELRHILVTGLLLQVGYQSFFFLALFNSLSPGLLAIILGVQPILTPWLAKERTSRAEWVGLVLGLAGLSLVVANTLFVGSVSTFGVTSGVLSLLSITLGTVFQKRIRVSLISNMAIQYTGSALALTSLALIVESYRVHWTGQFLLALSWMVLVVSVTATLLLYSMIRQGKVTHVASLFYLVPPVTAGLDFLVFGHMLTSLSIFGMAMVVAALALIGRAEARTRSVQGATP